MAFPKRWVLGSPSAGPLKFPGSVFLQESGALAGIPGWLPPLSLSTFRGGISFFPGPEGQISTQMESPTQGRPKECSGWNSTGRPQSQGQMAAGRAHRGQAHSPARQDEDGTGRGPSCTLSLSHGTMPINTEWKSGSMSGYVYVFRHVC